jgi:NADPH:quinone reductase-like Zn-dependent oxidoreductase
MRALVPNDDLASLVRFCDVAEPVPAFDEVVVAVEAFSVNRGETFLLERPTPGWRSGSVMPASRNGANWICLLHWIGCLLKRAHPLRI